MWVLEIMQTAFSFNAFRDNIKGKLVEAFCLISEESYSYGSHDTGDPSTTNLYIGNINPTVSWNLNWCIFIYFVVVVTVLSNVYHEASIDQSAICFLHCTGLE